MNNTKRALGAVAISAALAGFAVPAQASSGSGNNPHIIGGSSATNPAFVQLKFGDGEHTYGCTGEAIAEDWVLTAQHCIEGTEWMDVYYGNTKDDPGTAHAADNFYGSPNGDVALVHLASANPLSSYPKLADSYTPSEGSGTIYGYGLGANKTPTEGLRKATVNVVGSSKDAFGGDAVHVEGDDGASNHGDSGGPLIIDDQIVGVCSTGDTADPGDDTHAGSNYANLTESRSWIQETAGV